MQKILKCFKRHIELIVIIILAIPLLVKLYFKSFEEVDYFEKNGSKCINVESIINDEQRLLDPNIKKVFFVETHLEENRKMESARQTCSVESAALANPEYSIYFLLITNKDNVTLEYSTLVNVMLKYKNIHIRFANLKEIAAGTPLERFVSYKLLERSRYQLSHTSDMLRYILLYKYGGVYLDLDVISTLPLKNIENSNFACLQSDNYFAAGLIGFDLNEGRKIMFECMQKVRTSYNPFKWGCIGPEVITKVLRSHCIKANLSASEGGRCNAVTAIATPKCFLTTYEEFYKFFEEKYTDEMAQIFDTNDGYFIHVWNKMLELSGRNYNLDRNSKAAYIKYAKIYCPRTVQTEYTF